MHNYLVAMEKWAVSTGLQIILLLGLTLVASKVVNSILDRVFEVEKFGVEEKKRIDILRKIAGSSLVTVIFVASGMIILGKLGVSLGPLLATFGIAGLALGYGGKELVKDLINGFFILLEDQIRIGDFVLIGPARGTAEKIGLRKVVLRDPAGNVCYIRNGNINMVTNMTKEYSRYVFDIRVAYHEDIDRVFEIIKEIGQELGQNPQFKDDILEPVEILGVDSFTDSGVVVKARIKTKPGKQRVVGREFNRCLKKKFDQLGIQIPFPCRNLYLGEGKNQKTMGLRVSVKSRDIFGS